MSFDPDTLHQARDRINVTPLIDVLLVLLIVFLVGTPAMLEAIPSDLARETGDPATIEPPGYPVLALGDDGGLKLDGRILAWDDLEPQLTEIALAAGTEAVVLIRAGDGVPYGAVIRAMDLCRGAGIVHVSPLLRPVPGTSGND